MTSTNTLSSQKEENVSKVTQLLTTLLRDDHAIVPKPLPVSRQVRIDQESKRPEGQTKHLASLLNLLERTKRQSKDRRGKKNDKPVSLVSFKAKDLTGLAKTVSLRPLLGNAHYTIRLVVTGALSADGSGVIATSLGLNPSSYQEWAECAELFDEFRVTHGSLHITPTSRYNRPTTDTLRAIFIAFDNDSAPTMAAYNDIAEYANVKPCGASDEIRYDFRRPNITASAYWTDVSSPSGSAGSTVLFSAGNTNSVAIGIYLQEIFVEFRGRV